MRRCPVVDKELTQAALKERAKFWKEVVQRFKVRCGGDDIHVDVLVGWVSDCKSEAQKELDGKIGVKKHNAESR